MNTDTTRSRRHLMSALQPLAAVVDPVGAVPKAVEDRAFWFPLLATMVLTSLAGAAVGARLETSRLVIPKLAEAQELSKASEREISEQIDQAQRVAIVAGVAKGLFVVPLQVLLAAAGLWVLSWLFSRPAATFAKLFTVVALAMLPVALSQGVLLASALNQPSLSPKMVATLVPSSLVPEGGDGAPPSGGFFKPQALQKLLGLVDFFHLWSALLLGLGLSSAAKVNRAIGVPSGAALYFLVMAVVTAGIPGLMDGAGGAR
jgi:hypothetical protein